MNTQTKKLSITKKADLDGYYYIIDLQTNKKVKLPNNIGYGKIENKFIKSKYVYNDKLRIQDAIQILNIMNLDINN